MLDWLIVGGGIHGTHLSFALTKRYGVPRDRVRVLDPYREPLARWHQVTENTGMRFLRSPLVHHLHYDQGALGVYARIHQHEPFTEFIPPYARPTLDLFNRHARHLIDKYNLAGLRVTGRAGGLTRLREGWRVETDSGGIEARRVLLALGLSEQPRFPAWARGITGITHIFAPDFRRESLTGGESLIVVGGGITAAQTALTLSAENAVTLLMRHPVRAHDFDSEPCWMNLLCLRDFHKISDYDQRRHIIREARHPGSLPPDVRADLAAAISDYRLFLVQEDVKTATATNGQVTLTLHGGNTLTADRVLLATGYESQRPGGAWLEAAIAAYGLPVAACGYPIVDRALCWQTGLHVSGALAELEIGPAARNIIGARLAGERLKVMSDE